MQAALDFPNIAPEIFSISLGGFELALRWYAMAYIVGILIGWWLMARAARTPRIWRGETPAMTPAHIESFITWAIIGIVAGGRLGYVIFYQPGYFLANPAEIVRLWDGGMSFHGGFLGVVLATLLFCRRNGIYLPSMADVVALAAPPGILLGRIANFINGELWGRPSDAPWAVIFPGAAAQDCPGVVGPCARHPSQLYEAGLEGLLLGAVLIIAVWGFRALRAPGLVTGLFLVGYGAGRFVVEFFRQADPQFMSESNPAGYAIQLGSGGMTMGQLLSLPMVLMGLAVVVVAVASAGRRRPA